MANTEKNFDQYFREKLANHEEKPAALAWERLESQLPKKQKAGFYPFLKIAAAIFLLLSAGIVLLKWSGLEQSSQQEVAEVAPKQVESKIIDQQKEESTFIKPISPLEDESSVNRIPTIEKPSPNPKKQENPTPVFANQEPIGDKMVAEAIETKEEIKVEQMELPEINLPDLKITNAVAFNETVEEAPEYKVIIKSKGLKEEAPKQGLIGELEEKVEKIEGIWNKLGQGFADLQDAKENLFANNSPRKERSK